MQEVIVVEPGTSFKAVLNREGRLGFVPEHLLMSGFSPHRVCTPVAMRPLLFIAYYLYYYSLIFIANTMYCSNARRLRRWQVLKLRVTSTCWLTIMVLSHVGRQKVN
jgi:hypothetical protein